MNELLETINTADIILFVHEVCDHIDARFPEGELKEWSAFSLETLDSTLDFDHGIQVHLNKLECRGKVHLFQ